MKVQLTEPVPNGQGRLSTVAVGQDGFPSCTSKLQACIVKVMPLTQKHVDELKAIYRNSVGEELSDRDAWDMAIRLINLFRQLGGKSHTVEEIEHQRTSGAT